MSQYRDDRDGARQRIADLEAQLVEREEALAQREASLVERDAEVARLRHRLVLAGIVGARTRPVHAAVGSRMVLLSAAIATMALFAGVVAMRAPQPVVIEVVRPEGAVKVQPILADPAQVAVVEQPAVDPVEPPRLDEAAMRRQLEPRVWAGQAAAEEIRMLKAICSHQGDRACRDRAASLLRDHRPSVF